VGFRKAWLQLNSFFVLHNCAIDLSLRQQYPSQQVVSLSVGGRKADNFFECRPGSIEVTLFKSSDTLLED